MSSELQDAQIEDPSKDEKRFQERLAQCREVDIDQWRNVNDLKTSVVVVQ
jgi:hypothetical protein